MNLLHALNQQGLKFLSAANHPKAIEFFRAAITVDVTSADSYTNLGVALFMNARFGDAIIILNQALSLRPDHTETLLNLAHSLWRTHNWAAAITAFQRAIVDFPPAHIALGAIYWEIGDEDNAIKHCEIGLLYDPDSVLAHDTLRDVYFYRGSKAEAVVQSDELIRLMPNQPVNSNANPVLAKALVLLAYGDPAGWAQGECRFDTSSNELLRLGREDPKWFAKLFGKRWDGQPTGHLIITTEQGYGDVIQFLRFVPLAAKRCTKLSLHVPPTLRRIVRQTFGHIANIDVCETPHLPPDFDHYCLIMSLAYLLDQTETFPPPPYLTVSPHKYGEIRRLDGLKVGLVWAGNITHPENVWRSIPFDKISRLLRLPARFILLQFPCDVPLAQYPIVEVHPTPMPFDGRLLIDWTETAALIDTLDLVISVDTAVIHMAGAIGKPVWLLNRYNTDWRWMLQRSDSPWYPSMRIFRQPKLGDWDSVIDEVSVALSKLLGV